MSTEWERQQDLVDDRRPARPWPHCRAWAPACPIGSRVHLCQLPRGHDGDHVCPLCHDDWAGR